MAKAQIPMAHPTKTLRSLRESSLAIALVQNARGCRIHMMQENCKRERDNYLR